MPVVCMAESRYVRSKITGQGEDALVDKLDAPYHADQWASTLAATLDVPMPQLGSAV